MFNRKKKFLQEEVKLLSENLLESIADGGIWVYTLQKSGTTYTLLFLSNYLNLIFGDRQEVDFDTMHSKFFFHSAEKRIKTSDVGKVIEHRNSISEKIPKVIHTHIALDYSLWNKCICLYRNPLDQIISSFYFHKIKRGKSTKSPKSILPRRMKAFSETYKKQLELEKKYPDRCLRISYEDLITNPFLVFSRMVKFLGLPFYEDDVFKAMENSSVDKVKEMEEKRGSAIVVPEGTKFSGSFINSGKIGQWKTFFNDKDIKIAESILKDYDVSLDDFVLG